MTSQLSTLFKRSLDFFSTFFLTTFSNELVDSITQVLGDNNMSKYSTPFQQLQAQRTLITSEGDYPLPPVNTTKKDGRVLDTGINFVVYFADGSEPIPCRKLKDALLYVNLVSIDKMPESYKNRFQ